MFRQQHLSKVSSAASIAASREALASVRHNGLKRVTLLHIATSDACWSSASLTSNVSCTKQSIAKADVKMKIDMITRVERIFFIIQICG